MASTSKAVPDIVIGRLPLYLRALTLIESGVRAILNHAPITLSVPPHVQARHIDPVIHLQHMTYYLS